MSGRIAAIALKPGMERRFLDGLRNQGIPALMELGCLRLDVFLDHASGQAIVFSLWPTRRAAEDLAQTAAWKSLRARLEETLDGEPVVRIMDRVLAY